MISKTLSLLLLFILLPSRCNSSVIFTTVLLMDSSRFSSEAFTSLVQSLLLPTSITVHSIESDTMLGAKGKSLFEDNSGFFNFQVLHITRVKTSVKVDDEKTASVILRRSFPHDAAQRGLGIIGIESVEFGEVGDPTQQWLTTTYLELPSFAAQYLILGWALTILGFFSCVLCYCCCCIGGSNKPEQQLHDNQQQQLPVNNNSGVTWPTIVPPPLSRPPPTNPMITVPPPLNRPPPTNPTVVVLPPPFNRPSPINNNTTVVPSPSAPDSSSFHD